MASISHYLCEPKARAILATKELASVIIGVMTSDSSVSNYSLFYFMSCVVLCCVVLCCVLLCCVVLSCVMLRCVVLCCVVMCCDVMCCVVMCCVVLCCVVFCCVVVYDVNHRLLRQIRCKYLWSHTKLFHLSSTTLSRSCAAR
jgi:hypothetical protein